MALIVGKNSEIPEDAVVLNEIQALNYTVKVISGWEKSSEV